MQFIVPQFIDREPKIFGPLSMRQFFILIFGGVLIAVEWHYSNIPLFIILALPSIAIIGVFAFADINGVPFHYFILNFLGVFSKPVLRLWSKNYIIKSKVVVREPKPDVIAPPPVRPMITHKKLSELALIVDTGGAYQIETNSSLNTNPTSSEVS